MAAIRKVGLITMMAVLAAPVAAFGAAQARDWQDGRGRSEAALRTAYDEGYRQGQRFGEDHGRRGAAFNFGIVLEYRQADLGYRFGSPDRYRQDFRIGFERGYREAYERERCERDERLREGRLINLALDNGFRDGYAEGLNDGRRRHRDDPFAESRYRSADRGFDWRYGNRELYRANYREGFRSGYERGYDDGWRRW
jgi:flagellar biosynthesis/type III secretory pathway protein FliH